MSSLEGNRIIPCILADSRRFGERGAPYIWNERFLWNDGFLWNDAATQTMGTNAWVAQE